VTENLTQKNQGRPDPDGIEPGTEACGLRELYFGVAMDKAPDAEQLERIRRLEQVVQENPFDEDPVLELGRTYVQGSRFMDAVALLENLKSIKPDATELYSLLGISYLHVDRTNEAMDNLRIAMHHSPEEGYLYWCLGDAHFKAEQFPQAIQCYKRSTELEPGNSIPLRKMALEILKEALKYDTETPELWSSLGWALIRQGEYSEAIGPLKHALALKPDDMQCVKSLALAAFAMGRKDSSFQFYKIALGLNGKDEEALFGLGILFVSTGDLKNAYRQYETLQSVNPILAEDLYGKIVERKELLAG
jgi:protein O-GlcNAc transferase